MSESFVLTVDGKEATIRLFGQDYRARIHSQGWWREEGREPLRLELTVIVPHPPTAKLDAAFQRDPGE